MARVAGGAKYDNAQAPRRDVLIAGIAQTGRATIATRNTRHFEGLDVSVVDPWKT